MTTAPQQYTPPTPAPQPKNGLGTTSLVMGIVSIVFAWVPFVGFATYATSILGIITGVLGGGRVRRGVATNGGAAMGGLITSIIGLLSVILATVVYSSLMYAVASSDVSDAPTTQPSQAGKAKPGEDKPAKAAAGIGDTVKDGDFAFTITNVKTASNIGGEFGEDAQGKFVIVNVTVKNHGDSAETFDASNQKVYDTKSREFTTAEAQMYLESDAFLQQINPGNSVKGKLVFDMPKKANAERIELHGGLLGLSDGVTVSLR